MGSTAWGHKERDRAEQTDRLLKGAVMYGSGCHRAWLGCSSRTEAPISPAAGSADG